MADAVVNVDLAFISYDAHHEALRHELGRAVNNGAHGLLVCGSVARGTASPTADLDLRLYWPHPRPFEAHTHGGVLVECHHHSMEQADARLTTHPLDLYAWQEARILHDPTGALAVLKDRAHQHLAAYRAPAGECRAVRYWLESTLRKLRGEDDVARQLFLVHTTTWKLLEGLCVLHDRPAPPSTLMWEMLPSLPGPQAGWWRPLLLGTPRERVAAFVDVTVWLLN